jgi:hypothetical protein
VLSPGAIQGGIPEWRLTFAKEGVVFMRGIFDSFCMSLAEQAFQWSLDHPGPGAHVVLKEKVGAFYQDHSNPAAIPAYRRLLCETGLTDLIANVMGSQALWLLYEQIWLKENGDTLRTPWHQDSPYVPMAGSHLATVWISLDPVDQMRSLEFVSGSHLGPLYNPTAFDADNPTATMFAPGSWPVLPDIEAQRDAWHIVSFAVEPGDVIMFHPAMLHGGAPTQAGERRRTVSLRFFGDDAYCDKRPESELNGIDRLTGDDDIHDPMIAMARQSPGTLFRHPGFLRLR